MATAVGALHVDLGLNSAQFQSGIGKAQASLSAFERHATKIGAAIGVALAAIPAALGTGIKSALNAADDIGKAAQKVGSTTEELSGLKYAAELSDVSFEDLQGSMGRLAKNMADVAAGAKGPAAQAFAALGISVKNTDGTIKTTGQALAEIAGKFEGYRDGTNKTAIAMALMGRNGATLIPMLNAGKTGLQQMADEARRFGLIVTNDAAKAAENFNDNLTRVAGVMRGAFLQAAAAAAPYLEEVTNKIIRFINEGSGFESVGAAIGRGFSVIIEWAIKAAGAVAQVGNAFVFLRNLDKATSLTTGSFEAMKDSVGAFVADIKATNAEYQKMLDNFRKPVKPVQINTGGAGNNNNPDAPGLANLGNAAKGAAQKLNDSEREIVSSYQRLKGEAESLYQQTRTPLEAYQDQLAKLGEMMNPTTLGGKSSPLISQETYTRAVEAAQERLNKAIIAGSEVAQTLQSNFNSMFDSFLSGTFNARDALKKLLQDLAKMMMNKLFNQLLGSAFGEGSPFSFLGIGKNANGTKNWRGGLSWVGERGPELVNLPKGSQVIPNRALQGGGAKGPTVNVINNNGSNVQTETRNGPNGPELFVILDGWFADRMQKNAGPSKMLQQFYGLRRGAGRAR